MDDSQKTRTGSAPERPEPARKSWLVAAWTLVMVLLAVGIGYALLWPVGYRSAMDDKFGGGDWRLILSDAETVLAYRLVAIQSLDGR